jgi:hypothetical protein
MTLGDMLLTAAGSLPYWRVPVAMLLGVFVLGLLWFVAEAWGEP